MTTDSRKATIVYVDGFNLYYGSLRHTSNKWLDLSQLCQRLLPKDNIVAIRYFTALVIPRPGDPQQAQRQQAYLRALQTIPNLSVHLGTYRSHNVRMALAHTSVRGPRTVEVIKTEEKGSDVNLATLLLVDAFQARCQTAVVISNDSDLKMPIEIAQRELGISVGVVNPHPARNRSRDLNPGFFKQLRAGAVSASQFPAQLVDAQGSFQKPASW